MSVPWKEGRRMISREEEDLRWAYYLKEVNITEEEFNDKIKEIRERTGKP